MGTLKQNRRALDEATQALLRRRCSMRPVKQLVDDTGLKLAVLNRAMSGHPVNPATIAAIERYLAPFKPQPHPSEVSDGL